MTFTKKFLLFLITIMTLFIISSKTAEASWNPSYIISDQQFIAQSMNEQQIQAFLIAQNSYLANYKIPVPYWILINKDLNGDGVINSADGVLLNNKIGPNNDIDSTGWSAAKVISMSATWYGLNPQVILTTLQKEQSLVTTATLNQYGINWAMGYAVPDSGERNYAMIGFSRQVDWGTWQLRWNMDKANSSDLAERSKVSPYYTGNTVTIDGVPTYLGNGATASLYRYTPHYHGNENFDRIFTSWFSSYDYQFVSAVNPPVTMSSGQTASVRIVLKNTGTTSWLNETQSPLTTPVRLNVINGDKLGPSTGWIGINRIKLKENLVAPGQNGTFEFTVKMTSTPGTHLVQFVPLVENITTMKDVGMAFRVTNTTNPLYRFYDSSREIRYYTGSENEKNYILSHYINWKLEKIEGNVYRTNISGTVPVYQFYHQRNGTSYYTASWSERQWIISKYPGVWRYVGIGWHAYNKPTVDSKPVYLLWSDRRIDNLLTTSSSEKNYLISHYPATVWRYVGIQFYINN